MGRRSELLTLLAAAAAALVFVALAVYFDG